MNKRELIKLKKGNARLYPIYKMFSWDLLFYYAISFVFLTSTKGFSIAQVMLTDALVPVFKIILNIPSMTIIDKIGKRNSLVLANFILALSLIALIYCNGLLTLILAYIIMAFAFSIKSIAESDLLYESVSHRKGKSIFSKIEEIGARNYYFLDGITSMATGFLFVVNGYLPMLVSLMFVVVSIALSTCFKEVTKKKTNEGENLIQRFKNYKDEVSTAFKFIFKSHRLQAIMMFTLFFDGLIYSSYTLRESMLTNLNVPPQFFAIIISGLTIVSGIFAFLQQTIHNKFRNRALTFLVSVYVPTFVIIGLVSLLNVNWVIKIAIILAMYMVQYAMQAPYHTLSSRYIKNFTTSEIRTKISSSFDLIKSISQILVALFASYLLTITTVENNFIILGIMFLIIMFVVLMIMKSRVGLKPEEYRKEDIKFKVKKEGKK
ncbi:MAG: MFS transporter [Clostridiales bacterium]|nr:MFS transporter [Clostridiales bacterium]